MKQDKGLKHETDRNAGPRKGFCRRIVLRSGHEQSLKVRCPIQESNRNIHISEEVETTCKMLGSHLEKEKT